MTVSIASLKPLTISPTMNSVAACKAESIWFAYKEPRWILKGIDLEIASGAFLIVMGPSGSGKTTLVKILAGFLKPQSGRVELLGQAINNGAQADFRRHVGYIPQQLGLVRSMTALENVLMGALGRTTGFLPMLGIFPRVEVERAREYLDFLGIAHKANEKAYNLSGGERQRVAIARTLVQKPKIVFADEFVSDLDLPRAAQVLSAMRDLGKREGIAFVINLHEVPLVQELGQQIIIMKDGCIVHHGDAQGLSMSLVREVMG
ncbi:MAG: ATP-binding cassette domain-containing protein [Chloroflexi bacterium]|nr:ATP-binding cassette domain-containing protein [Chloroflexota bacterium]